MLSTGSDILNIIIAIFVYSWIISIAFGFVLAISYPIFTKTNRQTAGVFVPLYNLFELCDLNGYKESTGILFLIPFFNIIMMMLMSYKLKDKFETSGAFNAGLLLLPIIFVPLLAYGNKDSNDEYEKEEKKNIEKEVPQEEPVDIEVDSIFKTPAQLREDESKPYRAKKVQVNEKFINSAPAEEERIEKLDK